PCVPETDFLADRLAPCGADRAFEAQREQHARAVGRDLNAGAKLCELRRLLIDLDRVALAQQRERGCQPANACADDQDAQSVLHSKTPKARVRKSITTEFQAAHGVVCGELRK